MNAFGFLNYFEEESSNLALEWKVAFLVPKDTL